MTWLDRAVASAVLCLFATGCAARKGAILADSGKAVRPTLVVTGQIIDAKTRAPLPGVLVLLLRAGAGEVSWDERTDSEGRFVVPGTLMLRNERPTSISFRRFERRQVFSDSYGHLDQNFRTHVPEEMTLPEKGDTFDVGTILLMPGDLTDRLDVSIPRGDAFDNERPDWRGFAKFGNPGLDFSWTRPNVTIRVVVHDSPAEKAGIKVGDVVISVDGHAMDRLGPGAVRYLVGGAIGTSVKMVVTTPGSPERTLELQRFAG